jgi:hypothetical protein
VLDASQFPGSDIGAQINNAYASCPAAGCHIRVDAGNYNFSTAINFATNNKAVELDCDSGAYGSTSAVTQLIYSGTGPAVQFQNGTAQGRALTGCALVGPGRSTSTIGLLVGGCPNLASYPTIDFCTYTGNGSLTGAEFSNFDISGFGLGVMLGNNFYLSAFRNGRVHDNGPAGSVAQNPQNLVYPAAAVSSGETISFYNVHFIQSTANAGVSSLCVDFEGSTAVEMSFDTSSFDNCPIALNGSTLSNSFMRLFKGQDSSRADGSRRGGELVAGQVAERGWSTRPAASFDSSTYATVASNLRPMFTSQREKWAEPHIIAVVELDMQKMRVRFVLAREAIRERMRELERPKDHYGERQGIEDTSG